LSINGVYYGQRDVNGIWIKRYTGYSSTMKLDMPSYYAWTRFVVDTQYIINGWDYSEVIINNLQPDPNSGVLNLNNYYGGTYYDGGGSSYTIS
jgi:hypothetical protein